MVDKLLQPGDYQIREIKLVTYAGVEANLTNLFTEVNLYEDVLEPFMTGDISLSDGLNLIKNLPITGNDTLRLSFATAGKTDQNSIIEREFFVYKISDRARTGDRLQTYILHFASPELIMNRKVRVSQSFNDTPEAIVESLLRNKLRSTKQLQVQEAKRRERIVVPNWTPVRTINWLTKRALPRNSNAPSYLFFENTSGFNFVSLESLISPDNDPVQQYIYEPKSVTPSDDKSKELTNNFRNVDAFTVKESFNTLDNLSDGMYGGRIHTFDLLHKQYRTYDFDYDDSYLQYEHIEGGRLNGGAGDSALMPRYKDQNGKLLSDYHEAHQKVVPIQTRLFDDIEIQNPEEYALQRDSLLAQISNIQVIAQVAGDSSVRCGDVVEFVIPSPEPQGDLKQRENQLSGRFLVTAIRHIIDQNEYRMVMEFSKDSLGESLPSAGTVT